MIIPSCSILRKAFLLFRIDKQEKNHKNFTPHADAENKVKVSPAGPSAEDVNMKKIYLKKCKEYMNNMIMYMNRN